MGMAGETWCHRKGAEKTKKRIAGSVARKPVRAFSGLCRAFRSLPFKRKTALPL